MGFCIWLGRERMTYDKVIAVGKLKILEFEFHVSQSSPVDHMFYGYMKAVSKHVDLIDICKMPTLASISRWTIKIKSTFIRLH